MSLTWYARRFARMSPREVLHRVEEQVKRSVSRHRRYGWDAFSYGAAPRVVPGLAAQIAVGLSPSLQAAVRVAVDAHLAGRFNAHGRAWPIRVPPNAFPDAVWRLDPISGRSWPGSETYCFDTAYRDRLDLGDVKYVWDFNRLQFLQPLAVAAAFLDDGAALSMIEAVVTGWSDANPPFQGLGWSSGIELALRAVSLVLVHTFCGLRLSLPVRERVVALLRAHLFWLRRFPSRYSSANNHRVAELLGIFVLANVLGAESNLQSVADAARRDLDDEALRQIHSDGVGAEQSPTYAAFTAEMLLLARQVGSAFDCPLTPQVDERLAAFASQIAWLADAQGIVPHIGDDDGGRVITSNLDVEQAYPASVARAITGALHLSPVVPRSADAPELRHAIFGGSQEIVAPPCGVASFEAGGYTIVRERRAGRRVRLTFDHGALGYLSIAAHGHADANAITLSLDDREILVDPGTYLYHAGGAWRDWFRGTRAHNTLAVADADQSLIAGAFNWSHKATARLLTKRDGADWFFEASHDGYSRRFGVDHCRSVESTPTGLVICDRLSSARYRGVVTSALQFAPDVQVTLESGAITVRHADDFVLRIIFSEPGDLRLATGKDRVDGGWISPAFGRLVPATRLVWRGTIPLQGLRTTIDWS